MTDDGGTLEAVGPDFALGDFLAVRTRTWHAVAKIGAEVHAGMSEHEAKDVARTTLASLGMRRGWHRIYVRCGRNTTKDYDERSDPGVVLGENDIFFVDIGPVYGDLEGDAGDTFVLGDDPDHHRAKRDVRAIFDDVRREWLSTGRSGRALYDYAVEAASDRGWRLGLGLTGHRLSEFPHRAHYAGTMADVDFRPAPDRWVLEIAITHPGGGFGAFYEDLLLGDEAH